MDHPPHPTGVIVRPATAADGEAIIGLVLALADYERLPPPDPAARARLLAAAFGPQPRVNILLAAADGEIAGYAFFFETYSTFLALPTLYLEDLFVLDRYRGRGLGLALMQACAQEAVQRGCGRLDWTVLTWNAPAIGFYDHLGAQHLADWQLYRLAGPALAQLAGGA
ncbi:MAG: GNAT family N-acetyltransferase [Chloroflexota bacterium]|nr:GNAT family N-acetyltransferase [Chloroflexota bacterium]